MSDEGSEVFGGVSCCFALFGVCDDYYLLRRVRFESVWYCLGCWSGGLVCSGKGTYLGIECYYYTRCLGNSCLVELLVFDQAQSFR